MILSRRASCIFLLFGCIVLAGVTARPAHAQIPNETVQGDRLDKKAPRPPKGKAPLPPSVAKPVVPNAVGGPISAVTVEGSSLPKPKLDAAMKPFIGATISGPLLQKAADAVSAAYAHSDVALYSILVPQQTFAGGVVRIIAVENWIDEVVLAGDGAKNATLTRAYAAEMARERPLSRPNLERNLLLMNDLPGATTTPRVLQGDRLDTVKLLLETKREPMETVLTLNTRGAERLGRTQLQGDVYFNGWAYEGNQTQLTAAASSDFDRFVSLAAAHTVTFAPSGVSLVGSFGWFRTRPDDGSPEGHGYVGALQAVYPLIRSVNANVYLAGGLDALDSDNALFGQTLSSDRTRVLRAAASASVARGKTNWTGSVSISQGLDALGARSSDPFVTTPRFTKGNLQLGVSRAIGEKWRVSGEAAWQISRDALPAAELLALGGAKFGRGFETGAVSGDSGVAGSLEIARAFRPWGLPGAEVYGFVDGGRLWLEDRPGLLDTSYDLASAGAGVRFRLPNKTVLGLEAARPIDVIREGIDSEDWRLMLSIGSTL